MRTAAIIPRTGTALRGGARTGWAATLAALALSACEPAAPPPPAPEPIAPERLYRDASRSVAMVYAAEASGRIVGRGSGVFLDQELLVTSCHVIARGKTIHVGHRQKRSPARLAAYDAERDLCALLAPGLDIAPARIGKAASVEVGQRVYAIGAPEGFELTLSEGIVSGLRDSPSGRYLQITAPLSEGSSGGGLFDSRGRLIGITAFVYSSGQNLNFAAPVEWAVAVADKAAAARRDAAPVALPPQYARQWRPPLLN